MPKLVRARRGRSDSTHRAGHTPMSAEAINRLRATPSAHRGRGMADGDGHWPVWLSAPRLTCQNVDVNADDRFQNAMGAEYAEITRTVSEFDGRLITIKSWSVTLSLAGIGLGFQQQHWALFALAAATGTCFWMIEAMTKRHQVRYYPRMRQIEAWSAASSVAMIAGLQVSAPRIDWAWTAAGKKDPATALNDVPREMTSVEIQRMRRQTFWLPHVFIPSALAVPVGLALAVLAALGVLDIPL